MLEGNSVLLVISGPSGSGKGTLVGAAMAAAESRRLKLSVSVSMTSRPQKAGETEGISYFFVDEQRFCKAIEAGELLEYNNYNGNYYGTPRSAVLEKLSEGCDVILEIDVNGGAQIKESFPQVVRIFIMPPSMSELERRLVTRGRDSAEDIARRLGEAKREMDRAGEYDYVIINDDLNAATDELLSIIIAENCRVKK
ncbi:MAG: guanylate kinase [Ruminococcaceae bacterium]|nr:guanylate kinase [Oscillospiraceae bacterium]